MRGFFARGGTQEEMIYPLIIQAATQGVVRSARRWIFHLGGLGFIPLGLLDASIIPLPGSMDVLTIVLAAKRTDLWLYYAVMATVGSVIGELATYRLARRGGKQMVERKVSKQTLKKVYAIFERWGFGAIAVPAILPPPVPLLPFVLAAGALQYSQYKFTAAMALGRMARYTILAFLAARYGRGILKYLSADGHWIRVTVVALLLVAIGATTFWFTRKRKLARA
jgi:membrane protein YqaA with SNARE-associated domain